MHYQTKNNSRLLWLMGGLGNQLFQIQFANWLNKYHNSDIVVNDILIKNNIITKSLMWTVHENVLNDIISMENIRKVTYYNILPIITSKAPILSSYSRFYGVDQYDASYAKNMFGYFQNKEFLYKSFEEELIKLKNIPTAIHDRVMHLRGGEMNDKAAAINYYNSIFSKLERGTIHVVSSDEKLMKFFQNRYKKLQFINLGESVVRDFEILCSAKEIIIAPSTFSWWAARLGVCERIVAPQSMHNALGPPKPDGRVSYRVV